jgi:hypothetical protein
MTFKQKIHTHCLQLLNNKIEGLEKNLKDLGESAANDTKSSAGDKHETARAMIHIEQETITKQLNDALKQKVLLKKIDTALTSSKVINGSLVKTNQGYLFLSIAFGKINLEGIRVMVLSPQSPLGVNLIGMKANESTQTNGMDYLIEAII